MAILALRTRADYLDAALELLAEGGIGAVTIAALCERLGVTKGSFYHHFTGGPDLHASLARHWATTAAQRRLDEAAAVADPLARLTVLKDVAVAGRHDIETAVRAWARRDPTVAEVVRVVDVEREGYLAGAFVEAGLPAERAQTLARVGLALLLGVQERGGRGAELQPLLDEYHRWLLAVAAGRA